MQFSGLDAAAACTSSMVPCLQQAGVAFLGRYYSATTHIAGKKLTPEEAQLISNGGMAIVVAYEDDPVDAGYFSAARGVDDAKAALSQAALVGQPNGSAIYFTVDYDATSEDVAGCITEYFQSVVTTINRAYTVGVYGSGLVCSTIIAAGLATFGWLSGSTGYQGSSDYSGWVIKQGPSKSVCGETFDTDVAQDEYGAFTV